MPGHDPAKWASPNANTAVGGHHEVAPVVDGGHHAHDGPLRLWGRPEPAGFSPSPGMEP